MYTHWLVGPRSVFSVPYSKLFALSAQTLPKNAKSNTGFRPIQVNIKWTVYDL